MFPRWLTWSIVALLGYLVVVGTGNHTPKTPVMPLTQQPVNATSEPTKNYPLLSETTDMEHWKRAINPDYAAHTQCDFTPKETGGLSLKVTTDREGRGEEAKCGDMVTVHLTVWSTRGTPFYSGDVVMKLGERQVAAGLDAGLLGMRVGEVRTLILPPAALIHDKKSQATPALLHAFKPDMVTLVTATRTE